MTNVTPRRVICTRAHLRVQNIRKLGDGRSAVLFQFDVFVSECSSGGS